MRKQLFLTTAIIALFGVTPAEAQYAYRPSDKPSVEINLGALDEAMEQKDHAERDVTAEDLPPAAAPAPMAVSPPATVADTRPAAEELTAEVANPEPQQGRKLLASTHDDQPAIHEEAAAPMPAMPADDEADEPQKTYQPYLTAIPAAAPPAAEATPEERVFMPAHPQAPVAQNDVPPSMAVIAAVTQAKDTPPADAMKPIVEKAHAKPVKIVKAEPKKIRLAQNDDFTPPAFEPKVEAPKDSGKPAIVSKPPSMPPAVLAPVHPVAQAMPQPAMAPPAPVETPPAAPPAAVMEPTALPAPAPAPVPSPAPVEQPASVNPAITDHQATGPTLPTEEPSASVVPTMADLTLDFTGSSSDLTPETQTKLNNIVKQINEMESGKLQVRGYASGEDGSKSSARRISLSRALSVRSYLMDKGVKPMRVDVRAMGSESDRTPIDRVDLIFNRE